MRWQASLETASRTYDAQNKWPLVPGMKTICVATRNSHKAQEIQAVLGPNFACRTLQDFPTAPTVVEDALTFAGNARKKAESLARWLDAHCPRSIFPVGFVLADDSGLEVDALGGAPGVHSARFAMSDAGLTDNASHTDNNSKLLRLLAAVPEAGRTARFRCVIAWTPVAFNSCHRAIHPAVGLKTELFEGVCEGHIGFAPRGNQGFGYDPLFYPVGFTHTFAELGEEIKNRISHRSRALQKLHAHLAIA